MVDLRRPGPPKGPAKPKLPFSAPGKPPPAPAAALQAAKKRAASVIGRLPVNHEVKATPLLEQYLETLLSDTAEAAQLKHDLLARAQQELARLGKSTGPLCELMRPLQSLQAQRELFRDVLKPAKARQISSRECADRLSALLKPKTPLLDTVERLFGPLTLTVGGGAEAGAGFGIEGGVALAFSRRSPVGVVHAITVAVGAYAETAACIQAGISGGRPKPGGAITMDVSASAANGIGGEFLISLTPVLHPPKLLPDKAGSGMKRPASVDDLLDSTTRKLYGAKVYSGFVVDYEYAGWSVSMGVGAGLGGAIGFTGSTTFLLSGFA